MDMSVLKKYMSYMKAYSAEDITFMCILNKQKICKIGGGGSDVGFLISKIKKLRFILQIFDWFYRNAYI